MQRHLITAVLSIYMLEVFFKMGVVMRKLIIFLLITLTLGAQERPKIGLVLSGGGARGGAHLGVIKMLEKYNIPIDAIAGTSMGAFIGGLYASGMSSSEIEEMLVTTNWNQYIVAQSDRRLTPFRHKMLERTLVGNMKVGINSEGNVILPSGVFQKQYMLDYLQKKTFHVSDLQTFDELRIPYRAVATNALNGDEVVLSSGSLAKAIYSSIAIPGGFEPISIDGVTLFDGGVSSNLPVDVMRDMDVDIIIAIDISTPFNMKLKIDSYLSVMGQLTNILMRKNVEDIIDTLKDNEILITPDLGNLTPLDADKYPLIISIGEKTINNEYTKKLEHLSISSNDYDEYRNIIDKVVDFKAPIIDEIEFHNSVDISDNVVMKHLHIKKSQQFDISELQKDIEDIYNLGIYASVDYHLERKNDKTVLIINTKPAYNTNGQIRLGFGFSDDFRGRGKYQLKAEYSMHNITDMGGEWRNQVGIGDERIIYSEFYLPMDYLQEYYFKPNISYVEHDTLFSASAFGLSDNVEETLVFYNKNILASVALGKVMGTTSQFEVGFNGGEKELSTSVLILAVDGNNTIFESNKIHETHQSRKMYASYTLDSLDSAWFPTTGYFVDIMYSKEVKTFGSDFDYDKIDSIFIGAFSKNKHTLLAKYEYGTTIYKNKQSTRDTLFSLGGFANLSGYPTNAFLGESKMLALLTYRYRLTDDQFFGSMGVPVFAGFTVESGKVYSDKFYPVSTEGLLTTASAYIAADSIIGPIYLAYGETFNNNYRIYLYVGSTF